MHENVIAYLQVGEVLVELTPKECDQVTHKAKRFKWNYNSFSQMWMYEQVQVVLCLEQCEGLV